MSPRLEEVMTRIGSRPALIQMSSVSDFFGDSAPYRIEEGVAMIDIRGPLSNAAWSWGGTTYGDIQNQLKIATADPNVRGILLNVNSPGGETDNCFETAAMISAAAKLKPVYACAATMAYSAAYLLVSQADKLYCTPISGGVGSIGVYCAHTDYSEMLKQAGVKVTLISAGEGKTSGNPYQPLSDADYADIKEDIDRLYGEFVASVSSGRGIDSVAVVKLGARCYEGAPKAVSARLADAPGDLSTAWVDLCAEIERPTMSPLMRSNKRSVASATNTKEKQMETPNAADATKIAEAEAAKLTAALDAAKTEGYADAGLIVDLCSLSGNINMAAGFLAARKPVADVRKELLAAKAKTQEDTDISTGVMPGVDAGKAQGKARPWSEVMAALGGKKEKK